MSQIGVLSRDERDCALMREARMHAPVLSTLLEQVYRQEIEDGWRWARARQKCGARSAMWLTL